jgi:hypothetical protein
LKKRRRNIWKTTESTVMSSDFTPCKRCKCPKCDKQTCEYFEDSDGDYYHRCTSCKKTWTVNGSSN